jgi:hypothetical protein
MGKKDRLTKITGPGIEGPRIHRPHFEGLRLKGPKFEGPHFHPPKIELTKRGRKIRRGFIALSAITIFAIAELSGGSGKTSGHSTNATPGASSSSTSNPIPEAFRPGKQHKLTVDNRDELSGGGIILKRIIQKGSPTDRWHAVSMPSVPTITDGKIFDDPFISAKCILKDSGVNFTAKSPKLICNFTSN